MCTTCVLKSNFQLRGVLVRAAFKRYVSERFFVFDKETLFIIYLLYVRMIIHLLFLIIDGVLYEIRLSKILFGSKIITKD